jgi:hypothetical protein
LSWASSRRGSEFKAIAVEVRKMTRESNPMLVRRLSVLVTASLIGLILCTLAAAAQSGRGKPELRAEGRRSDPGSSEYKERVARKLSINKWEQTARELHGVQFANWRSAKERRIECEHYREPALNGRVSCVAIALPYAR